MLEANNYDVIVAQTGAEAYSMVTSQCPDVVILDLGLPDMDGMTFLEDVWDPESAGRTDGSF